MIKGGDGPDEPELISSPAFDTSWQSAEDFGFTMRTEYPPSPPEPRPLLARYKKPVRGAFGSFGTPLESPSLARFPFSSLGRETGEFLRPMFVASSN